MRRAMASAEVGDDVFEDDPTVAELEARAADLLGKEAGLFVASGTMGNLVSVMAHVPRGGEIITPAEGHIPNDEAANYAVVAGAGLRFKTHQTRTRLSQALLSLRTATRIRSADRSPLHT
jgi:threonine aldolase